MVQLQSASLLHVKNSRCKALAGLYVHQGAMAGCAGADASMAAQSTSATLEAIPTPLLSPSCNVYGGHAQVLRIVRPDHLTPL